MYEMLRDHRRWVLPEVLAFQARVRGDKTFVSMVDGGSLTYAEAEDQAHRVAAFFASLGVERGDTVAVMLPNGLDYVRAWLGLGRLGAILVALNTDLKGAFLEHQLRNSGAKVALSHSAHLATLEEVAERVPDLATVVVAAPQPGSTPKNARSFAEWQKAGRYDGPTPQFHENACIIYTSGTTGPSKGVLMPYAHCYLFGLGTIDNHGVTENDVYYICMPFFHVNGLCMQLYATLIAGASAVLRPRFSASNWLSDIRQSGATITNALGAMAAFVFSTPPSPNDRDHRLRIIQVAPNPPDHDRTWRERFGLTDVLSGFGMTEVNLPVFGRMGETRPGICGVVYGRYFELEVRNPETDEPLPPGTIGEIVVRPRVPFGFMAGYHNMPDKTVEAWRNFWFHTGDAGVIDQAGYLTFLDRIKDCIRRRGENISSFEVERAIGTLPGVEEVAAYAVPSPIPGCEDEVMLAVVPAAGAQVDAAEVARHAERELPRFAQPRFIRFVDSLPKTPTAKVQKNKLRAQGVTENTWDREKTQ